jgi:hypothetical protein
VGYAQRIPSSVWVALRSGYVSSPAIGSCAMRAWKILAAQPDAKQRAALDALVAFAATMRTTAADEAIEVFDLLMADLARTSANHEALDGRGGGPWAGSRRASRGGSGSGSTGRRWTRPRCAPG